MSEEGYVFTNGWTMQREAERPFYWCLCDADGVQQDRDKYRHDVIERHRLVVERHEEPRP